MCIRDRDNIKKIPRDTSREKLIDEINRINSQIRGVIQYYQCCTWAVSYTHLDVYKRQGQTNEISLFAGLIKCGECGKSLKMCIRDRDKPLF